MQHQQNKSNPEKDAYKRNLKRETPLVLTLDDPIVGTSDEVQVEIDKPNDKDTKYRKYNPPSKFSILLKEKTFEMIITLICSLIILVMGFNLKANYNLNREVGELIQNVERNSTDIEKLIGEVKGSGINDENINKLEDEFDKIAETLNNLQIDVGIIKGKLKK